MRLQFEDTPRTNRKECRSVTIYPLIKRVEPLGTRSDLHHKLQELVDRGGPVKSDDISIDIYRPIPRACLEND